LIKAAKKLFERPKPLSKGMHHMRGQGEFGGYRLHLRIEDDGRGILIINASKVLHLNQTASEIAMHVIQGDSAEQVGSQMKKRYKIDSDTLRKDYEEMKQTILTLAKTDDICPITYLNVERIEPFETPVSAPYRMDIALTYECENDCRHCYVARDKNMASLSVEEWKGVLRKLWDIGIPHVCFTGGEPTLHPGLLDLVSYAEEVGIVTGLLTNGRKLSDASFVKKLEEAGLDHIQITLESHDKKIHDEMVGCPAWKQTVKGIENALASQIYTMTNTTITKLNEPHIERTIQFLKDLGVRTFAANGLIYSGKGKSSGLGFTEKELVSIVTRIRDTARRLGMKFIWYTPTQYSNLDPVALDLGPKTCTAAKYNMCIEPNGDVIPCQSWYEPLGNILRDQWKSIWNSTLALKIRNKELIMEECKSCEQLPVCGGGCPLYNKANEYVCVESKSSG
jgi:radical SAM protein with 4Fe4S-binding SPASM domain